MWNNKITLKLFAIKLLKNCFQLGEEFIQGTYVQLPTLYTYLQFQQIFFMKEVFQLATFKA